MSKNWLACSWTTQGAYRALGSAVSGNDEITDLSRTIHHLASDVASLGAASDDEDVAPDETDDETDDETNDDAPGPPRTDPSDRWPPPSPFGT